MKVFARVFLSSLPFFLVLSQPVCMSSQEWERFRTAYPYHIQAIALSGQDSAGGRVMIISEPPPSVTLEDIKALDPALGRAVTMKHKLGVDGWVKDVVIDVPPLAGARLNALINRLQVHLFGTSYKAYVVGIPTEFTQPQLQKLNLRVTSGDLQSWVFGHTRKTELWPTGFLIAAFLLFLMFAFGKKRPFRAFLAFVGAIIFMINASGLITIALGAVLVGIVATVLLKDSKIAAGSALGAVSLGVLIFAGVRWHSQHLAPDTLFSPLLGGKEISCASILEDHRNGVFISSKPGLILWSFGKNSPLDAHAVEIRQFALDSDLIIGAVSSSDQVAILARERATPVAALPPLRTETILQLAAAREDELSQSYERKNPFAGRYDPSKDMDWAPIYLSPRLIDTEYGSLLNITDQLLKGWTEHGKIHYVNFTYPDPPAFPFSGALDEVLSVKELTFNWNTKGAGYVTKTGDYEIYALNQTGALPIDYLAAGNPNIQKAEDTAYEYYTGMNDPNLIRVVQYAAIYQIFHHYSVVESTDAKPAPGTRPSPLIDATRQLLGKIAQISDARIDEIPDPDFEKTLRLTRDGLQVLSQNDPDGSLQNVLASALASRDGFSAVDAISDDDTKKLLRGLIGLVQEVGYGFVSPDSRKLILLDYMMETGERNSQWIHTPSIVASQGTQTGVGGHNLSSRITTFEADDAVAAGHVTVEESGNTRVIHFNPSDNGRIGDTVRNAARDDEINTDKVRANVEAVLGSDARKPAPLNTALGFDEAIRPDPSRGFERAHAPDSIDGIGWRRGGKTLSSQDAKFLKRIAGKDLRSVLVARDSNGIYVISAPPAEPIQAFDLASTTDAFLAVAHDTPGTQLTLHFRGFDDRQAEGFMHNIDAHSEVRISVGSTEEYVSPETLEEIFQGKYDWTRAELTEDPSVLVALDGQTREVHAALRVPAQEAASHSLIIRLKISLSNAIEFTQQMLADLPAQIRGVLSAIKGDDARSVARALVDELKKDQRFATVQAQVQHDQKTIFYVKNHDSIESQKTNNFAA